MSTWEKESYLREVCAHIRWKQAHEAVRRELGDHIDDQQQAFMEAGLPAEEAARRAVEEMGDPAEAGARLNRHYRPRMAWNLVGMMAALMLTGVLMRGPNRGWGQLWLLVLAIFVIGSLLPLRWYTRLPGPLYVALCIVTVVVAHNWFPQGWKYTITQIQRWKWGAGGFGGPTVSLLAGMPVLFAAIVYRMRGKGYRGILACMGFTALGIISAFLVSQIGFAQILSLVFPAVLAAAAQSGWFQTENKKSQWLIWSQAAGAWAVFGAMVARAIATAPAELYWLRDGMECVEDAVGHAHLLGRGMVNGTNWGRLMNDLNLAWFLGHRGWLPTILILALVALFLAVLLRMAQRQPSALGRLVCGTIAALLTVETVICVLCSLFPRANILLVPFGMPFLTRGAFMLLYHAALCSVFLSACRSGYVLRDGANEAAIKRNRPLSYRA